MATKTISIAGQPFELTAPYVAGQTINDAEAKTLNQTRCENIGNNFRKDVKAAVESNDAAKLQEVINAVAAYDKTYTFSMTTAREPVDPVESEAFKIAREVVKDRIAGLGFKSVKDYIADPARAEKYEAAVEKVAVQPDTLKLAKQRVAAKAKTKDIVADDLGLAA
jgi:hypothetical protein